MKMVMGGETEYAISARGANSRAVDQGPLLTAMFEHVKRNLGYTSLSPHGRFLSNGGLLYLDAGLHIEWATPECTSPFDVVRYLKAGDQIVHELTRSFKDRSPDVSDIFCSRTNVDYVSGTLWAAHESYMHEASPAELPDQLAPFLASRVILGAGGWDHRSPGLRFTMSPRAHFITRTADRDSQYVRPLFHTKDEALSGTGSHRLHVACSESLCSETGNVLRFGTTALVLALIERGVRPASGVTLTSPVRAVQRFATDLGWRARVAGEPRRSMSAVQIQRHYLESVEAHVDQLRAPEWAEPLCRMWRALLDDLEEDPTRLETTLDWAIKRRLFERQLGRRGIAWSSLRWWNAALERFGKAWGRAEPVTPFEPGFALDPPPHLAAEQERLRKTLARHGLDLSQLADLDAARREAFELDARFAALGECGIFNALEAAGALRHQVGGVDVESAVTEPPRDTRARIRGDVVRRLSDAGVPYGAWWTAIFDNAHRVELDLHDPFETRERWREWKDRGPGTKLLC